MVEAVLAVLLSLPQCWADRQDTRKFDQLVTVALAVTVVADGSVDRAAKLLTTGHHESRYCIAVHSGAHRGPGRGVWQLEGKGDFVGLDFDATLQAARMAGWMLDHSYQCGGSPRDVFTAYAAKPCGSTWKTLADRVRTYRWISWRLTREVRNRSQSQI